jgi:putative transposase
LIGEEARWLLHFAWLEVAGRFSFATVAICLLPEHLHGIWSLPEGGADYSKRRKEIKRKFARGYLLEVGPEGERNASRVKRGEAAVWQRRIWEHTIRDEEDLNRHLDYIHYNLVKHGLAKHAADWPWSSFHRYVREGYYARDWGVTAGERVGEMRCGE